MAQQNNRIVELETIIDQLNRALDIIANSEGDFTQNLVNDALVEVGYYTTEESEE